MMGPVRRSSLLTSWRGPALAGVVALGACGSDTSGDRGSGTGSAPVTTGSPTTAASTTAAAPPSTSAPAPAAEALARCADVPTIESDVVGTDVGPGELDPVLHGVLLTYAEEHRDTFGGMWLDREAGGTMVLAFTDDPDTHRVALASAPTVRRRRPCRRAAAHRQRHPPDR